MTNAIEGPRRTQLTYCGAPSWGAGRGVAGGGVAGPGVVQGGGEVLEALSQSCM